MLLWSLVTGNGAPETPNHHSLEYNLAHMTPVQKVPGGLNGRRFRPVEGEPKLLA
ncbi:MAG TPA: hypothetical protein VIG69_09030 [Candidatus Methylomirabilis sp.]|jgi:hypothetical protein